jgi:vacuolar-type H+-ATPase subunit E/Vma4
MGHQEEHDKLLQTVREQATLDRDKVLAQAQDQVRIIEAQTRDEIEQIERQIQAEAQRAIALERDRLSGQAKVAFRLARQASRVRLIKQAFAQAGNTLAALPQSPKYRDILGALIAEALDIVGPEAEIKVAASEETLCRAWIRSQGLRCSLQAVEAEPGTVLVISPDGTREVDNSLATRLSRAESLCSHEVAAILFEEASVKRGDA